MEKEEVGTDNPVAIAEVTLIPVAKVSLNYRHDNSTISFFGAKQPVAVVVISGTTKKAFRTTGEEVPLDQLIQEVPDIKEILDRI